ncbi:hypothetical protein Patl1_16487 [Pistacia atlantica]|uniref:Uncharacterized protein n=1 Tax=Pistacia atlantica TaxID=434234 RepID=A0ACC1B7J0_9ROSI|nr:hypothetical protein Patl1_16487 [Pistacia atlantica]
MDLPNQNNGYESPRQTEQQNLSSQSTALPLVGNKFPVTLDTMSEKQLIVAVEGTAAMGPFWHAIVSDYLEKIISC